MDKNSATKLIKAKALGCLEQIDDTELIEFMESAVDFPWAELGEYQNLVSLLPLYLPLELPEIEVKENLGIKLTELKNQLFPVVEEEPEIVEEKLSDFKEETIPEEVELNIQEVDNHFEPELNLSENVIIDEQGEEVQDIKEDILEDIKPAYKRGLLDEQREKVDRRTRENIKKLDDEISALNQTVKRNFIISISLIVVLIVMVIFIYLSLSSRISDQQDKIDRLQNKIGLLIPQTQFLPENFYVS